MGQEEEEEAMETEVAEEKEEAASEQGECSMYSTPRRSLSEKRVRTHR